jgi:hypothetical protein
MMIGVITVSPLQRSVNRLDVSGRIVSMVMGPVKRCVMVAVLVCGCHIGRPPVAVNPYKVGQVVTRGVEPGLKDALRDGLAGALSARSLLSAEGAQPVSVAVLSATVRPTGVGPNSQIFAAMLSVSLQAGGRVARFSAERSYSVIDPVQGAAARATAFSSLAAGLMNDAGLWLAHAPGATK